MKTLCASPADDSILADLVALSGRVDADAQVAVTSQIRRHVQAGARLTEPLAARLLALLPTLERWEARLHVLQTLPVLPVADAQADTLYSFLERCVGEPNKFVRAWAYGGLHRVALLHPRFRATVRAALERARREEAPSVRARLRRLPALPR